MDVPICPECGQPLILLPSGWRSCPDGHGKLVAGPPQLTPAQKRQTAKHDAEWRRKLKEAFPGE